MKLTNQQIEDAMAALGAWNPAVSFKTKLRLSRNLRKLKQAHDDKEHDRMQLVYSAIGDKTKRPENRQDLMLTAEEQLKVAPDYRRLMAEEVEVDIHTIQVYDSTGCGEDINTPWEDPGVDLKTIAIPNEILSRLIDVVLVEYAA